MTRVELRRSSDQMIIKTGEASTIVKEYMSFSLPRKQQYFIAYEGNRYSNEDARKLLDQLRADEWPRENVV